MIQSLPPEIGRIKQTSRAQTKTSIFGVEPQAEEQVSHENERDPYFIAY